MRYLIVIFFYSALSFAQTDTVHLLDEVKLYGNFSRQLNSGYQVHILSDSIINSHQQSLGNLLQNQANLYFKQHGNGMLSSISLRGSGASHTGVYWNGIAINSALNGQTDFNTFSANGYNQIEIRKGGGGILFGSGAVAGAINLRDKIIFKNRFESNIHFALGSYATQKGLLNSTYSTTKFYAKVVLEGNQSDNDYPYLDTDLVNENGNYKNYHLKGVFGYALDENNRLELYTTYSDNDRNLSRTLSAPNESKLTNTETRLLLSWKNFGTAHNSSLKVAYLQEEYNFYASKNAPNFSFGKSDNILLKYDYKYFINNGTSLHAGIENSYTTANGSDILDKQRNNIEAYTLFHHKPLANLVYNLSLRKGFSSVYNIPLIYAVDLKYDMSSKLYLKANFSTNYRLPTYNDLFWNPGGNPDLLAEDSTSGELGAGFLSKNLSLQLTSYITKNKNLIQWHPETPTFWRPINVQNVNSSGLEFDIKVQRSLGQHHFKLQSQYAYTVSTDTNLDKQLLYVPYHKANAIVTYAYNGFTFNFNQHYNGEVFITTSNTQTVDAYWLSAIEVYKSLFKKQLTIGVLVHNLWNTNYQSVSFRPMPNRNFEFNINYKF